MKLGAGNVQSGVVMSRRAGRAMPPVVGAAGRVEGRAEPVHTDGWRAGSRLVGWLGAGLGSVVTAFGLVGGTLGDTFHYGEYFVAEVTLRHGSPAGVPMTIHGGVDYLPAQLNRAAFGDGYLFPTWLTLAVCALVAAVVAVQILVRICPSALCSRSLMFTGGLTAGDLAVEGCRRAGLGLGCSRLR